MILNWVGDQRRDQGSQVSPTASLSVNIVILFFLGALALGAPMLMSYTAKTALEIRKCNTINSTYLPVTIHSVYNIILIYSMATFCLSEYHDDGAI